MLDEETLEQWDEQGEIELAAEQARATSDELAKYDDEGGNNEDRVGGFRIENDGPSPGDDDPGILIDLGEQARPEVEMETKRAADAVEEEKLEAYREDHEKRSAEARKAAEEADDEEMQLLYEQEKEWGRED